MSIGIYGANSSQTERWRTVVAKCTTKMTAFDFILGNEIRCAAESTASRFDERLGKAVLIDFVLSSWKRGLVFTIFLAFATFPNENLLCLASSILGKI